MNQGISTFAASGVSEGCATKQRPRLEQVLDEISNAIHSTREAMQSAAEAGYRIGSSTRLSDPKDKPERPASDRIEDRLHELLARVHSLNDMAREIRDHLDSLA